MKAASHAAAPAGPTVAAEPSTLDPFYVCEPLLRYFDHLPEAPHDVRVEERSERTPITRNVGLQLVCFVQRLSPAQVHLNMDRLRANGSGMDGGPLDLIGVDIGNRRTKMPGRSRPEAHDASAHRPSVDRDLELLAAARGSSQSSDA